MSNFVKIAWAPQPGNQVLAIACPVPEVLLHGPRGGGKTILAIMKFAMHVGKGMGSKWHGVVFRKSYKELGDIISKTKEWFYSIWSRKQVWYNHTEHYWEWRTGERLDLRHFERDDDYYDYHGFSYTWMLWEELTNWATSVGYKRMMSTLRSPHKEIAAMKQILATCNPYGPGHQWVKKYFRLRGRGLNWNVIKDARDEKGELQPARVAIPILYSENKILSEADPGYIGSIRKSASNAAELEAWLTGDWDVMAGGMFDDVWDEAYNCIEPLIIPPSWEYYSAYDQGSSTPFSHANYAIADGTDFRRRNPLTGGFMRYSSVPGDTFRIREWYGARPGETPNIGLRLTPREISKGIIEREIEWGLHPNQTKDGWHSLFTDRVADPSIMSHSKGENSSVAAEMGEEVRLDDGRLVPGLEYSPAARSTEICEQGWEIMRQRIKNAHPPDHKGPREHPGLFVVASENPDFLRTVPNLPRNPKNLKLVMKDCEDHAGDDCRYLLFHTDSDVKTGKAGGMQ